MSWVEWSHGRAREEQGCGKQLLQCFRAGEALDSVNSTEQERVARWEFSELEAVWQGKRLDLG